MEPIFINYRRGDASGYGGRLHGELSSHFGSGRVFRDVDGIRPGADFVQTIEEAVAGAGAVLVLMGRDWLSMSDSAGRRRLDDPNDFVRLEIASALDRGVAVIPVLLEGAKVPSAAELPEPLAQLARHQGIELSEERWNFDVGRLISRLEEVVGGPPEPEAPAPPPAPPETEVAPAPTPSPTAPRTRRPVPRSLWPKVLVPVVLVIVVALLIRFLSDDDPETGVTADDSPAAGAVSGESGLPTASEGPAETAEIGQTVWYWGFEVTLGRASLRTVDGARVLDVSTTMDNQGDDLVALDGTIVVTSKGRAYELASGSDLPAVPGGSTGKGTLSFAVDSAFALDEAVVTFGRSDQNQAVVPLGSSGELVTQQPVPVTFTTRTLASGVLSAEVRGGEVRGDNPGRGSNDRGQVSKGRRLLVLDFDSIATTIGSGYNVYGSTMVVQLPDGTTVGPEFLNVSPFPDQPVRDFKAGYLVNEPPGGTYLLVLKDMLDPDAAAATAGFKVG